MVNVFIKNVCAKQFLGYVVISVVAPRIINNYGPSIISERSKSIKPKYREKQTSKLRIK